MTVAELIAALQGMPQELEACHMGECYPEGVSRVRIDPAFVCSDAPDINRPARVVIE